MRLIHLAYFYGEAKGYVAERNDFIGYLAKYSRRPEIVLSKLPAFCAVLQSMHIDGDYQGQGLGKTLLFEFEERADELEASSVFLVADENEAQRENFSLESFYRRCGYRRIGRGDTGPIMLKIL